MSTIALGVIPSGIVLLLIVDWLRVARLYGESRMAAFRLMVATVWASQSRWLLFAAATSTLGAAYLVSDPLFWANVPAAAAVGLFAVPFSALMVRLRPPAVLFLGSSGVSQELYQGLRLRANRHRVIAFLAPPSDLIGAQASAMDGFRTRTIDWAHVVRRVAEAVPLVVIDTRHATPHVEEELRWLIAPDRRERVIFISTDSGALPALARLDMPVSTAGLHIARAGDCINAVRNRLRSIPRAAAPLPASQHGMAVKAAPHRHGAPEAERAAVRARVEVSVAGFLFSVGAIGPVGCMRQGKSLGLRGAVAVAGMGEDFIVVAEGERVALERFVYAMGEACPMSCRLARRLGFAGGLLVKWSDATGQFDSLPSEMPFAQVSRDNGSRG